MFKHTFRGSLFNAKAEGEGGGGASGEPKQPEPVTLESLKAFFTEAIKPINEKMATLSALEQKIAAMGKPPEKPTEKTPEPPIPGDIPAGVKAHLEAQAAKTKAIEAKLQEEQQKREAAERATEDAQKRAETARVLSAYSFATPAAQSIIAERVNSAAKRDAEGNWNIDGLGMDAWVKSQLEGPLEVLLAATKRSGSGASNQQSGGRKSLTLEEIVPGMPPEKMAEVIARIGALSNR